MLMEIYCIKCISQQMMVMTKVWKNAVAAAVKELQRILKTEKINIGLSAPGLPNENNTAIAFMPGRMQGLENL